MQSDGYGPSDQTSFYAIGAPVIHFFTGAHEEYHTPEDDPETLNIEGGAKIAQLTADTVEKLALGHVTPTFVRASSEPLMQGDGRGYGSYLGTVPDFSSMSAESGGVLLTDVRAGGPADLAGIRGGDTIIEMAGTEIENLYDMTYALQDHRPGETISVVVVRDGKPVSLNATLGDRARRSETPAGPSASPHAGSPSPAAGNPHASIPANLEEPAFELSEFYRNKPGRTFEIAAGKPFTEKFDDRHDDNPLLYTAIYPGQNECGLNGYLIPSHVAHDSSVMPGL